jgi:hypothetical protein
LTVFAEGVLSVIRDEPPFDLEIGLSASFGPSRSGIELLTADWNHSRGLMSFRLENGKQVANQDILSESFST